MGATTGRTRRWTTRLVRWVADVLVLGFLGLAVFAEPLWRFSAPFTDQPDVRRYLVDGGPTGTVVVLGLVVGWSMLAAAVETTGRLRRVLAGIGLAGTLVAGGVLTVLAVGIHRDETGTRRRIAAAVWRDFLEETGDGGEYAGHVTSLSTGLEVLVVAVLALLVLAALVLAGPGREAAVLGAAIGAGTLGYLALPWDVLWLTSADGTRREVLLLLGQGPPGWLATVAGLALVGWVAAATVRRPGGWWLVGGLALAVGTMAAIGWASDRDRHDWSAEFPGVAVDHAAGSGQSAAVATVLAALAALVWIHLAGRRRAPAR